MRRTPATQLGLGSARLRGFSLVELMVAMTLSLILLGGVVAIFISSRATYETTDRMSRIQESGRFALDTMVRDLRSTGFIGCSQLATFKTTLNNSSDVRWNFARAVAGYDGQGSTWVPTTDTTFINSLSAIAGTDILVVRTPRPGAQVARVAASMGTTTDALTIDPALQSTFNVGDIVMANDCSARTVFQVTAIASGNQLQHAATGSAPGNASDDFDYAYSSTSQQGGGEAVPMQTVIYYLARRAGAPTSSPPSLWRRVNNNAAEELVEGVENLQLAFGETTGGNMVTYRKPSDVTNWNAVVTVNIALLVRSQSEYGTDRDQSNYDLIDATIGARVSAPNDRHLRQVFATTVSLRNQTL